MPKVFVFDGYEPTSSKADGSVLDRVQKVPSNDEENVSSRRKQPEATKASHRSRASSTDENRDVLKAAAAAMNYQRRSDFISKATDETKTSASAPAGLRYPLRLRLHRLSKGERNDILRESPRSGRSLQGWPPSEQDEKDDFPPEHELEQTDSRLGGNSIVSDPYLPERHSDDEEEVPPPEGRQEDDESLQESILVHPLSSPYDKSMCGEGEEIRYSRKGLRANDVKLHIYDLISSDTLMRMPWGCVCEIGKCFNDVNSALHELGTGAYHVGVEVNGIEYAYGASTTPEKTGVFTCIPKLSPGYQYRTTIDFGLRPLLRKSWIQVKRGSAGRESSSFTQTIEHVDGRKVVKTMAPEYMGTDYDILRRNCCTFARDACLRLGIKEHEIPSWFRNLAESGAITHDLAIATVSPIANVFSEFEEKDGYGEEDGFEVVSRQGVPGQNDLLVVERVNATNEDLPFRRVSRTTTWAY